MSERATPLVVAVSGGIDSVVLLHLLVTHADRPLIVAHIDHGIRSDSREDEHFVSDIAAQYDVPFVSTRLELGASASEETARNARYEWLENVRREYDAGAIATAHHEDDVFETILINLERGTGWRGLCSLRQTKTRVRPLLGHSKAWIVDYALTHALEWRDDSTNESMRYLRNRIRHGVLPGLDSDTRQRLRHLYGAQCLLREEIADEVGQVNTAMTEHGSLLRYPLIMVEDRVAIELLRNWLDRSLEKNRFLDLLLFSKTARPGAKWSLDGGRFVVASKRSLIVESPRD
jgi:tRNA(Ile)-lysidine synthetase-like protein